MDEMHEKGIKAFPAKTEGKGISFSRRVRFDVVKVFDITCGLAVGGRAGAKSRLDLQRVVPAPQFASREGDRIRMIVRTSCRIGRPLHFSWGGDAESHGRLAVITQPPIKRGEDVHLRVRRAERGLAVYHSPQTRPSRLDGAAWGVHRLAEAAAGIENGRTSIT